MATAVKPLSHRCRGHRSLMVCAIAAAAILLAGILVAGDAAAQARTEPPKPASDPATPAPPAAENPGLVGVLGNWMQQGMTSMSTAIDAMFGAAKGAAGVAKGAADAAVDTAAGVTKLPVPGVASGH